MNKQSFSTVFGFLSGLVLLRSVVLLVVVGVLCFVGGQYVYSKQSCQGFQSDSVLPSGFGSPFSFFVTDNMPLFTVMCDTSQQSVSAEVQISSQIIPVIYTYKQGFAWNSGKWEQKTVSCANTKNGWCVGEAKMSVDNLSAGSEYFVAMYTCQKIGRQWKCGCRDKICANSYWQLQSFKLDKIATNSNLSNSNSSSTSYSGSSSNSSSSSSTSANATSTNSTNSTNSTSTNATSTSATDWKKANSTWYTSHPDAGSEECIKYNGCKWAGMFAGVNGKKSESWVKAHNIVAVHSKFFSQYNGKWLILRNPSTGKELDVQVLDMCSDNDCDGCCTRNMQNTGFLIDLEKYTAERFFGSASRNAVIDWRVK